MLDISKNRIQKGDILSFPIIGDDKPFRPVIIENISKNYQEKDMISFRQITDIYHDHESKTNGKIPETKEYIRGIENWAQAGLNKESGVNVLTKSTALIEDLPELVKKVGSLTEKDLKSMTKYDNFATQYLNDIRRDEPRTFNTIMKQFPYANSLCDDYDKPEPNNKDHGKINYNKLSKNERTPQPKAVRKETPKPKNRGFSKDPEKMAKIRQRQEADKIEYAKTHPKGKDIGPNR